MFTTSLRDGCADAPLGHSSKDFESPDLPSYQHFRSSMSRYDHHFPFGFDGIAALHCCFASTLGMPNNSAATQAVRVIDESCLLIWASRSNCVAASGSQQPSHRGVRELLLT